MDKFERKIINRYLEKRRSTIAELTPKLCILDLLSQLRPIKSGHELIRIGPAGDGGYLLPDDLSDVRTLFSPGVGDECGFEADCLRRGMKVFLADASVDSAVPLQGDYEFRKEYIGGYTHGQYISLDDWILQSSVVDDHDMLLQMDIEGAELEVMLGAPITLLQHFRIMVIEFHRLDRWWNLPFFELIQLMFGKILSTHVCVHCHPNIRGGIVSRNGIDLPRHVELTFLRRDRVHSWDYVEHLPHPLDAQEHTDTSVTMPAIWYQRHD